MSRKKSTRSHIFTPSGQKGVSAKVYRERMRKQYSYWRERANAKMPKDRQFSASIKGKATSFLHAQVLKMKRIALHDFRGFNPSVVMQFKKNMMEAMNKYCAQYHDNIMGVKMMHLYNILQSMSLDDLVEFTEYANSIHANWVFDVSAWYNNVFNAKDHGATPDQIDQMQENYAQEIVAVWEAFKEQRKGR